MADKQEIFDIIKKNTLFILPDVQEHDIQIEVSLKDLGANSLDRTDIALQSMEDLNLKMPLAKLGGAKNIKDLVDILYNELSNPS